MVSGVLIFRARLHRFQIAAREWYLLCNESPLAAKPMYESTCRLSTQVDRLVTSGLISLSMMPDQVTVNEYLPGQVLIFSSGHAYSVTYLGNPPGNRGAYRYPFCLSQPFVFSFTVIRVYHGFQEIRRKQSGRPGYDSPKRPFPSGLYWRSS